MHTILNLLLGKMDRDIRDQCDRRYQALIRQHNYLTEKQNQDLMFTYYRGWFSDRYKVLFAFNTFFQIVIGPLASSSRGVSSVGVGSSIPINYGASMRFDSARNKAVNSVYSDFILLTYNAGIDEWWLNLNQASDIVYHVAKKIRENEQQ